VSGSHPSIVQGLLSSQTIGSLKQPVAGLQSSLLQAFPSSQFRGVFLQPLGNLLATGSQSGRIHLFPLVQSTGGKTQGGAVVQSSVQLLLSRHILVGVEQAPEALIQVLLILQGSGSVQSIGVLTQPMLETQVSVVQRLLSLQREGALNLVCTQPVVGLQVSSVQASPSSQLIGVK